MGSSTSQLQSDDAQGANRVQLSVDALRYLIRQEVDRRLEEVGFESGQRQPPRVEADEVAQPHLAYDADYPGHGVLGGLALWDPGVDHPAGLADEDGEPLPSTLPEIAEASLSTAQAAARLGVNDSRIRQRLGDDSLYGFKFSGSWRLPTCQFEGAASLPHLDDVVAALPSDVSPVGVTRWLISPWEDLVTPDGELLSPRRWLLEGRDVTPVLVQARML